MLIYIFYFPLFERTLSQKKNGQNLGGRRRVVLGLW